MNIGNAKLAVLAWWARLHWQTTVAGFAAAGVVVLQRPDHEVHFHDVVAGILLVFLGTLGTDPVRLPSAVALAGLRTTGGYLRLLLAWTQANWTTTLAGFLSAAAVVLQRVEDRAVHWQDVVAAVAFVGLGVLAIDPHRLEGSQGAVPAPGPSPEPAEALHAAAPAAEDIAGGPGAHPSSEPCPATVPGGRKP